MSALCQLDQSRNSNTDENDPDDILVNNLATYVTPSIQPVNVTNFCQLLSLSVTVNNFLPSSPVASISGKVKLVIVTVDHCYKLSTLHRVTVIVNT